MAKHRESAGGTSRVERAARPEMATVAVSATASDVAEGVRGEVELSLRKRTAILMATGLFNVGKVRESLDECQKGQVDLRDAPELRERVLALAEERFALDDFHSTAVLMRTAGEDPAQKLATRGEELLREGKIDAGERAYENAGMPVPDSLRLECARMFLSRKEFAVARDQFFAKMTSPPSPRERKSIVMVCLGEGNVDDAAKFCQLWGMQPPRDEFLEAAKKSLRRNELAEAVPGFEMAQYSFERDDRRRSQVADLSSRMLKSSEKRRTKRGSDRNIDVEDYHRRKREREIGLRGLAISGEEVRLLAYAEKKLSEGDARDALEAFKLIGMDNDRAQACVLRCGQALVEKAKGIMRSDKGGMSRTQGCLELYAAREAFEQSGIAIPAETAKDLVQLYAKTERRDKAEELAERFGVNIDEIDELRRLAKGEDKLITLKRSGEEKEILNIARSRMSGGNVDGAVLACSYLQDLAPIRERLLALTESTIQELLGQKIPETREERDRERLKDRRERYRKIVAVLQAYKILDVMPPQEQLSAIAEIQLQSRREDVAREIYQALAKSAAKAERMARTQE